MMLRFTNILFFFGLQFVSSVLLAAPIYYSDHEAFSSALSADSSIEIQDFEREQAFGKRVGGGLRYVEFGSFSVLSDSPSLKIFRKAYNGNANTTESGKQYFSIDTDKRRQGAVVEFDFFEAPYAIGFNLIDHDADDVLLSLGGYDYLLDEVSDGESVFVGFITENIEDSLGKMVLDTGKDSQVSLDDFFLAYVDESVQIDAPSTLLLMGGALVLLGWRGTREDRSNL